MSAALTLVKQSVLGYGKHITCYITSLVICMHGGNVVCDTQSIKIMILHMQELLIVGLSGSINVVLHHSATDGDLTCYGFMSKTLGRLGIVTFK